ncbi:MAG: ComEC/Rec2 family competence protein [Planctomycetota bacterium]|jgi:beta-lactamase superfamily II metal-dependent hydrolase
MAFVLVSDSGIHKTGLDDVDAVDFRADALEIRLYYVGAGEAIVVSRNSGQAAILIDGGASNSPTNKKRARPLGRLLKDGALHAIVASHPHTDHGNFHRTLATEFRRKFAPGARYFDNGTVLAAKSFNKLAAAGKPPFERVPVRDDRSQDKVNRIRKFGRGVDVRLLRLEREQTDAVYRSVFTWIKFREARLLFAGHAEVPYEDALLPRLRRISKRAHVLKVTRHGHPEGTSAKLVRAFRPAIAVVSNHTDRGHRFDKKVRRRLAGARIHATFDTRAKKGDVIVRTDGSTWFDGDNEGILFEVDMDAKPKLGRVR